MPSSNELIELYWQSAGEEIGYKLKYPHILNFHAIIGACLNKQWISVRGHKFDLRVHPFIIRGSSSGKALSYDLAEKLSNLIGLDWRTRTQLTEAGLIGTIRLMKGVPMVIRGDAYGTDILGFTEAHTLLKASSKSSTMTETINMILDPKGEVHKKLATGVIEYDTRVSLVMSSFPSLIVHEQLNKGFLQRCFIFYENLPLTYYTGIMEWLADNIGVDEEKTVEEYLETIATVLKIIRNVKFNFDFLEVRKILNEIPYEFEKLVKGYFDINILKTFAPRYFNLLCKIACHRASLELRSVVNEEDILYAKELCLVSFRSVCNFVMDFHKLERVYGRIDRQFMKLKEIGKSEIKTSELLRHLRPLRKEQLLHRLQPYVYRNEIEILNDGKLIQLVTEERDKAVSEALLKLTKSMPSSPP